MARYRFKTIFAPLALAASIAVAASPALAGWFDSGNGSGKTDKAVTEQMNKLLKEGERQTGLPGIVNFAEKKAVKWLYELRDDPNFRTFSYIFVPMTGKFVKICDSVGYGINASIQYSNPQKVLDDGDVNGNGYGYLPQAEPNGLFMPEGLAATYVMCVDPTKEGVYAMYVEPEVVVTPVALPDALVQK